MSVNMKQSGALVPIASLTKAIIPLGTGDCYSTEERQVGTWIDGKPLYQKTYEFETAVQVYANTYTTIISNTGLNIDTLVDGETAPQKNTTFTPISLNYNNDNIEGYYSTSWSIKYLTIRYTKTTDTAGSGIWTPSGAAADHYSTTEQVVGTWINGKPLYRKTISVSVNTNSSLGGNIYHVGVDISSYIPNTEILLPRVDKSYLDLGNNIIRGFLAVLPEGDRTLDIYTAYERQGTAILTVEYTKTV